MSRAFLSSLLLVAALVSGCGGSSSGTAPAQEALREVSDHDMRVLGEQREAVRAWNRAAARWVSLLQDEPEKFSAGAPPHLQSMRRARQSISAAQLRYDGAPLRKLFEPIARDYEDKFGAIVSLTAAIRSGSEDDTAAAARRFDRVTAAARRRAESLVEDLRPLMSAEQFDAYVRSAESNINSAAAP